MKSIPSHTPTTAVCRGKPIFLIFDPKHRVCVPTIDVLSKNVDNINIFSNQIFNDEKFSVY